MTTEAEKMKICSDCKQEPATINYAESILDLTHGFNRWICKKCYDKIRDNNPWYKQGFQAGENSKHKSDLQQELEKWEEVNKVMPEIKSRAKAYCGTMTNGTVLPTPRDWLKNKVQERINLIKNELKEIEK